MTKLSSPKFALLGAAAVAACVALTAPTFAQSRPSHAAAVVNSRNEPGVCPGREAGNPYTPETDYMAWSAWRARGGGDDHNDLNCGMGRMDHGTF
jgi:hypothetical protein